jgi:protein-tyrosine phosphatase
MAENNKIKVLFVCLGNICRSPMAEAVFRHIVEGEGLADRFEIASSGTSSYHLGERPHSGTRAILKNNNVDIDPLKRAQNLRQDEVKAYDYVVAMDADNASELARIGINSRRLLEFAPQGSPLDVPDPYYTDRFEEVYQLVWAGAQGLLDQIRKEEGL